jgi:hypothetical protein
VRDSYQGRGIACAVRVTHIADLGALELPEDATVA